MASKPIRYHWLRLRAVAHPTEDKGRVLEAMRFVSGLEAEAFAAAVKDSPMETHHGLPSSVLECTLEKSRAVRDVLERVFAQPGVLERLRAGLDARTDDDGVFYLRAEKQAAFQGELKVADVEDCVQMRLKLETYPAGRDAALAGLRELLESGKP